MEPADARKPYAEDRRDLASQYSMASYADLENFLDNVSTGGQFLDSDPERYDLMYRDELSELVDDIGDERIEKVKAYSFEEPVLTELSPSRVLEGRSPLQASVNVEREAYLLRTYGGGIAVAGDDEVVEHVSNLMESGEPAVSSLWEEAKMHGKYLGRKAKSVL